jgi:hypothetical protein
MKIAVKEPEVNCLYWFTKYETPEEADYPIDCMVERCARAFRSQGCAERTAFGGGPTGRPEGRPSQATGYWGRP